MGDSLERFRKRQRLKNSHTIYDESKVDEKLKQQFLNSAVNEDRIKQIFQESEAFYNMSVSQSEVDDFLVQFKKDFNDERFRQLVDDCKQNVISSVVTPFGLGGVVAAYDKDGGNVTTIHNANQKIYARDEDKYNRKDYTNTKNSDGQQFAGNSKNSVGSQFTQKKMDKAGNVVDAYTGKTQKASTTSPDHIESLSQYHKDGGFMQSKAQRADFATDEDNLALTDRSVNQSMRDFDKKEWQEKATQGEKNKARFDIDEERLNQQIQKGQKTADKHLPSQADKALYYGKHALGTGVSEGGKMALQQALGLVITEFFVATFDEIVDIYKNGYFQEFDSTFLSELKKRLKRVATRLSEKWKDVLISFKDGFISGFISNLVTTVINMFVTTAKRVVRIIREGLFSLVRAVKLLLFPPEAMSLEERMHEAKKLIATGLIVSVGVILEEYVEKLIASSGVLAPYASKITTIFIGVVTGLSITMVVYYLDQRKNDKDIVKNLLSCTEERYQNIEKMMIFG